MAVDKQAWYEEVIKKGTLRSSGAKELTEINPLDWERLRVLKDGKLVPAMAQGHVGDPSAIDLELLYDAAQKGNLFFYRLGEEYPQQLADGVWHSTDPTAAEVKESGFFENLDVDIKLAIRDEMKQRKEDIRSNLEVQRAATADAQPLIEWYNEEFRKSIVQPSKDPDLMSGDGMDWSRVRIWNGKEFARAVPDGQKGVPDVDTLKTLQNAVENGNLFVYQRGDKYPSKWMGDYWSSMDKNWLESLKPEPVKPPAYSRKPELEEYTRDLSGRKLATSRALGRIGIKVYKEENEKYNRAVREYQKDKEKYDRKMSDLEADRAEYNRRLEAYQTMLSSYEELTPEQKAALEKDAQQREKEIEKNKEIEKKAAENKLSREMDSKQKIVDAEKRIEAMGNQPIQGKFLNRGNVPLGAKAYEAIAPHGYKLPDNSKITPVEAAAIHIVLAGSNQAAVNGGLSPMSTEQYGQMLDGMLNGDPTNVNWQYITASYDATKGFVMAYEGGDATQLGKAMGEGMRNLMNASRNRLDMTPEMAGLAKLTERLLNVLDTHKDLMEKCTLNQQELEFARGMVNLGRIYNQYLDARVGLTKMSTGAQQLSQQEVNEHTANLMVGKLTESRLNQERKGLAEPKIVGALGQGNGMAIDIVQFAYRNNTAIGKFANDPQTLKQIDLDKRMQGLAHIFGTTQLGKPKETAELREQIRNQVREQNNPQTVEERNLTERLDVIERQRVRELLVQQNPMYQFISTGSDIVTEKLNELREAREAVERESEKAIKEAPPKLDDPKAQAAAMELANKKEWLELDDPKVQAEAMERANVRELMQRENAALEAEGKRPKKIDAFNVDRRMAELRAAQKQLAKEDQNYELTSVEVISKAEQNKLERTEQFKQVFKDAIVAQSVVAKEQGVEVTKSLWRSDMVRKRVDQLKEARALLGEEGKNLPLDDMRVIQRDYEKRGVDPLKEGLVDINKLNDQQRMEYTERRAAMDYLEKVRGRTGIHEVKDRYSEPVETALGNLRTSRQEYERFVEGAEANLPLNHPKITAMLLFKIASRGSGINEKLTFNDVEKLSQDIQGKTFLQAHDIAGRQAREIQNRNPQAEGVQMGNVQNQPEIQQIQVPQNAPM